ncbi:MAG: pyridoxal-phosphate dependent enzyme [Candidatus Atribacteria bacterium]|nr:pyridoxal-phosphate dependent enzyme [Candidatus Atribacteria bacterium]
MIDLTINEEQLQRTIARAKEKNIIIPTFSQMKNPDLIPEKIKEKLKNIGLQDLNPYNLFRITWKNEPINTGGLFGGVNYLELPPELTGVRTRIIGLLGKWFPTGSHKVGATFGCLVPRLVTGQFDPTFQKAVWPSTGNFCKGGAYNSALFSCQSIAILPEGMSKERFEWLAQVAGEVITTPGSESNVKEIFDKSWELKKAGDDIVVFNQFEEFSNYLWHYEVTGHAIKEVLDKHMRPDERFKGIVLTAGSAGTLGCGDYLKENFSDSKIAVGEALQCPTMLHNGYGSHRIEGIGDTHIPWILNAKNTDMVITIDDNNALGLIRLFNEPLGQRYLNKKGVPKETIEKLSSLGISGTANLIMAIKFAKFYELTGKDIVFTVFTDSMELYGSRLQELEEIFGPYDDTDAAIDYHRNLLALTTDNMQELTYYGRKRVHNLKYFTWIEQQGKDLDELNAQWYDYENYWGNIRKKTEKIDELIVQFNEKVGLL